MSCSTATAPPPGIGDAFTSKIFPGSSVVVRRSHTARSSSAARTHSSTSGSRTVCTSACPTRTALCTDDPGISRCILWFVHWIRPAESTATTASCMESSSASNSRLLLGRAASAPAAPCCDAPAIAPARSSKSLYSRQVELFQQPAPAPEQSPPAPATASAPAAQSDSARTPASATSRIAASHVPPAAIPTPHRRHVSTAISQPPAAQTPASSAGKTSRKDFASCTAPLRLCLARSLVSQTGSRRRAWS